MAMVVKNNMSAINTLNTLNKNSSALAKSLQKVSSGMKINSAADDASGYAISERMRVQIRGLDQANQNTQNGTSMMKVAEGAVSSDRRHPQDPQGEGHQRSQRYEHGR
jgi:flagellin